jgi:putative hydrolase of the HAD superfamily
MNTTTTALAAAATIIPITTLIFDVDDTLYDVATGFTEFRNTGAVQQFMVEYLNFPDLESAKLVRDEYFERYHATAKALTVAEQEGRFPPPRPGEATKSPRFETQELSEYWATNLQFDLLGNAKTQLVKDLKEIPLKLVAFSNGPRKYVKRVLQQLGLWEVFGEDRLYAVDDVLPHCKPEKEAFQVIFDRLGVKAEECVLFEDSMKNIRAAKELGMKTVLITGTRSGGSCAAEATKAGDSPQVSDPAVDCSMEMIEEIRTTLPGLWKTPVNFEIK